MNARRRRDGRRYILIAVISAALMLIPVFAVVFTSAFRWSLIVEIASKVGEAGLIGVALGYFLDREIVQNINDALQVNTSTFEDRSRLSIEESRRLIERSVFDIKQDVFVGVMGHIVDNDIFSIFRETVILCPVFRETFDIRLRLTQCVVSHDGQEVEVLKCEWYEKSVIKSLQSPKAVYDFSVEYPTKHLPFMAPYCGVTKVSLNGSALTGQPFIDEKSTTGWTFKRQIDIVSGQPFTIEVYATTYKYLQDSDSFEMIIPSKAVEIEVTVSGCHLDVYAHVMAKGGSHEGGRHVKDGDDFHWIANSPMLPQQGIALRWLPRT